MIETGLSSAVSLYCALTALWKHEAWIFWSLALLQWPLHHTHPPWTRAIPPHHLRQRTASPRLLAKLTERSLRRYLLTLYSVLHSELQRRANFRLVVVANRSRM